MMLFRHAHDWVLGTMKLPLFCIISLKIEWFFFKFSLNTKSSRQQSTYVYLVLKMKPKAIFKGGFILPKTLTMVMSKMLNVVNSRGNLLLKHNMSFALPFPRYNFIEYWCPLEENQLHPSLFQKNFIEVWCLAHLCI